MKRSCDQLLPGHQHCLHGHVEDCPMEGGCGAKPSTCDLIMPHDQRYPAPKGCPPNCPTRVASEKESKLWPPTTMETK